ncbi:hypothetical protein [Marinitoga aeolica]|uniref:Uncharacterized protein n=1 Tax=Marinitoga aeolica TaxID=2809031 RepID=A0ABY8PRD4_9BACT|nr:hypothetical protein [Marinitoga aeolica]WGS65175.1 hypothetical protein JRV97_01055 [Marinitoga aeolica]
MIKLKYKEIFRLYENNFYNFFFLDEKVDKFFVNIHDIFKVHIINISKYNLSFSPEIQKKIYDFVFEKNLKYWYIEKNDINQEDVRILYLLNIYNTLYGISFEETNISNLEYAFLIKKILLNKEFWEYYLLNTKEFNFLFVILNNKDILKLKMDENEKKLFLDSLKFFFEKSLIINPAYFIYHLLKDRGKNYILRFFVDIIIKNNIPIGDENLEFLYIMYEYNAIEKMNELIEEYKKDKDVNYKYYLEEIEKVYDISLNPIKDKWELLYKTYPLPKEKNEYFKEIIREGVKYAKKKK